MPIVKSTLLKLSAALLVAACELETKPGTSDTAPRIGSSPIGDGEDSSPSY